MRASVMLALLAAFSLGCAKPPQQELTEVANLMETRLADDTVTPPMQTAFNAVVEEVNAQNGKFALLRSYSKARELIANFWVVAGAEEETWASVSRPSLDLGTGWHSVWVDPATGCQYLRSSSYITSRLGRDGLPICGGVR